MDQNGAGILSSFRRKFSPEVEEPVANAKEPVVDEEPVETEGPEGEEEEEEEVAPEQPEAPAEASVEETHVETKYPLEDTKDSVVDVGEAVEEVEEVEQGKKASEEIVEGEVKDDDVHEKINKLVRMMTSIDLYQFYEGPFDVVTQKEQEKKERADELYKDMMSLAHHMSSVKEKLDHFNSMREEAFNSLLPFAEMVVDACAEEAQYYNTEYKTVEMETAGGCWAGKEGKQEWITTRSTLLDLRNKRMKMKKGLGDTFISVVENYGERFRKEGFDLVGEYPRHKQREFEKKAVEAYEQRLAAAPKDKKGEINQKKKEETKWTFVVSTEKDMLYCQLKDMLNNYLYLNCSQAVTSDVLEANERLSDAKQKQLQEIIDEKVQIMDAQEERFDAIVAEKNIAEDELLKNCNDNDKLKEKLNEHGRTLEEVYRKCQKSRVGRMTRPCRHLKKKYHRLVRQQTGGSKIKTKRKSLKRTKKRKSLKKSTRRKSNRKKLTKKKSTRKRLTKKKSTRKRLTRRK